MEDAMLRSSPPPEITLGKRARQGDGDDRRNQDGTDTDPEETPTSSTTPRHSSLPSLSNVTAATLRYASKKKLRPDQRDEVDAFLLVCIVSIFPGTYI